MELPLDEVRRRLRITGQSHGGLRAIEVARIVGSVDRAGETLDRTRLAGVRAAFRAREMPPIEVYEAGGAYFVSDGHHRVAVARERGQEFLDASVTVLHTNYAIPPGVSVAQLVHTEQRRRLHEESGLSPDVEIAFARPRGYPELLETIKAFGYDLARAAGGVLPPPAEVAAAWHAEVFAPGVAAVHRARLPAAFPVKTEADLFLWIYERRRDLRVHDPDATFDDAARFALAEGLRRRDRKVIEGEAAEPLASDP